MADETAFLSIPEAAARLGVSRIAVFKRVKKGRLAAIRIGRNWAIPVSALETAAQGTSTSAPQIPTPAPAKAITRTPPPARETKSPPTHVRTTKPAPPPKPTEKKPFRAENNALEDMGWD